jgi:hypothetical protein
LTSRSISWSSGGRRPWARPLNWLPRFAEVDRNKGEQIGYFYQRVGCCVRVVMDLEKNGMRIFQSNGERSPVSSKQLKSTLKKGCFIFYGMRLLQRGRLQPGSLLDGGQWRRRPFFGRWKLPYSCSEAKYKQGEHS